MQIYLVGGAVRDRLLGLPVLEKDWVVVGQTQKALLKQGYKQVGKDFPVFLHPQTQEEYALARTERKKGRGYTGFEVFADPKVTLEQDLARRDLTINAIAEDQDGTLIDPFGGQKDLQARKLCHISPAFSEDPLRVLRLARFAAKLPDFTIAEETERLCKEMVEEQELSYLTKERVWQEWEKVWQTTQPARFISVLASLGAWQVVMPFCHSPSEDQKALDKLSSQIKDSRLFAVLGLYLSAEEYKKYHTSLAVPVRVKELAKVVYEMVAQYTIWQQKPEDILQLLQKVDALRRAERFTESIELVAILREAPEHKQAWLSVQAALIDVRPEPEWLQEKSQNIGQLLKEKKLRTIAAWQQKYMVNK